MRADQLMAAERVGGTGRWPVGVTVYRSRRRGVHRVSALETGLLGLVLIGLCLLARVWAGEDPLQAARKAAESGTRAARLAMQLAAENIANMETTRISSQGGAYQRKFPVFVENGQGVEVETVAIDPKDPIRVYDPAHPHADQYGFVQKPNIDLPSELVRMNFYGNWLEANAAVMMRTKQMRDSILELTR